MGVDISYRNREDKHETKKLYFLVGYIINPLLTILGFLGCSKNAEIAKGEILFSLGNSICQLLVGAGFSLSPFASLYFVGQTQGAHAKRVAAKDFPSNLEVQGPVEFQQLGQTFKDVP